jgi:hypothetical protein
VSEDQRLVNVAVTERSAVIETTQLPVPEHAPDQPVKRFRPVALADSVTVVPLL